MGRSNYASEFGVAYISRSGRNGWQVDEVVRHLSLQVARAAVTLHTAYAGAVDGTQARVIPPGFHAVEGKAWTGGK